MSEGTEEKKEAIDKPNRAAEAEASPGRKRSDVVAQLESQLRSEQKAKRDLRAENARLNNNIAEMHESLQRSIDDYYKKDDWARRVEAILHEERNRHQEAAVHYSTQLEDKDTQIQELRRCLEAQRFQLSQLLEEHSRAGQNLAQMLERERRDWEAEREALQSDLFGTRQMLKEIEDGERREVEDVKNCARMLQVQLEDLRTTNVELRQENEELKSARRHSEERRRNVHEKEISENMEEISELKLKLSKVNDRIEENFQRTEAEMTSLRNQLTDTIEERDRLVAELHALREKDLQCRSVRSSSISSICGSDVFCERYSALEGKVDDLKFELEEERTILQATQENLEEQLRVNRQLETELDQLRQNASQTPPRSSRQSVPMSLDATDHVYRLVMQLQDTLLSAQSQTAGINAKRSSSQMAYHASSLNISIEEARHQIESIRSKLESALGDRASGVTGEPSRQRPGALIDRKHRILSLGKWSLKRHPSSKKVSREQMKMELEESRKELSMLTQEKFALEQCIRYLSSRCQMYQTAWKEREGHKKHHRRVTSPSGKHGASTTSGTSGEIQIAEPEGETQPEVASMHSAGSESSLLGDVTSEGSPRLSRNLELKLIHKISSICEPFSTQLSETGSAQILPRYRPLREVSSFAS